MVELRLLFVRRVGDAVRAGKKAVHVIEAAVLAVDHHNGLYFCEPFLCGRRLQANRMNECGRRACDGKFRELHFFPQCMLGALIAHSAPRSRALPATKSIRRSGPDAPSAPRYRRLLPAPYARTTHGPPKPAASRLYRHS